MYFWLRWALPSSFSTLAFSFSTGWPLPQPVHSFFLLLPHFKWRPHNCVFLLWIFLAFPSPPPPHPRLCSTFLNVLPCLRLSSILHLQRVTYPPLYKPLSFDRVKPFCITPDMPVLIQFHHWKIIPIWYKIMKKHQNYSSKTGSHIQTSSSLED